LEDRSEKEKITQKAFYLRVSLFCEKEKKGKEKSQQCGSPHQEEGGKGGEGRRWAIALSFPRGDRIVKLQAFSYTSLEKGEKKRGEIPYPRNAFLHFFYAATATKEKGVMRGPRHSQFPPVQLLEKRGGRGSIANSRSSQSQEKGGKKRPSKYVSIYSEPGRRGKKKGEKKKKGRNNLPLWKYNSLLQGGRVQHLPYFFSLCAGEKGGGKGEKGSSECSVGHV